MGALLRPLATRIKKKRILIALEDEKSSRDYFDSWKKLLRSGLIEITIAPHTGSMPKSVVEAAKAIKQSEHPEDPYNEVWVVFDTEGPQNLNRFPAAKAAIDQAHALKFDTAVSNPAWEFWLLLHFEYYTGNLVDGTAARNRLKDKGLPKYKKGVNCFEDVYGFTPIALKNGKKLFKERYEPQGKEHPCDCHPCTEVHRLIESMMSNQ
jgi:hypothetical protein